MDEGVAAVSAGAEGEGGKKESEGVRSAERTKEQRSGKTAVGEGGSRPHRGRRGRRARGTATGSRRGRANGWDVEAEVKAGHTEVQGRAVQSSALPVVEGQSPTDAARHRNEGVRDELLRSRAVHSTRDSSGPSPS